MNTRKGSSLLKSEKIRKSKIGAGNLLPAIAIIIAILSALMVSFSSQAELAVLKNDIKALEAELGIYKNKVDIITKSIEEKVTTIPAPEHEHEESKESEQLQPTVEFMLQTAFTDGSFSFLGMGSNINEVKNPTLYVTHGAVVKIVIENGDGIEHDFVIEGLDVHSKHISMKGEKTSVIFKAEREGEFYYYCSIPGHRELGMEGKIVIEEK
ncbi:MAG: cupredoxin domain-containing protein [Nitrososphaerales archaeon]